MPVIARKKQGTAQDRIRTVVAEHLEMLEPGLSVLETSLRLGRTTIDVVAVDAKQTLVLVAVGEIADEKLLVSTLDAYVWCVAFPDNVRRLYPAASIAATRPPRVIVVAEQVPDAFLELVERLSVVSVECQELGAASPERDRETAATAPVERQPAVPAPAVAVTGGRETTTKPTRRPAAEPARVAAGFDSAVARQWESFLTAEPITTGRREPKREPDVEPVSVAFEPAPAPAVTPRARPVNGSNLDRHTANGHSVNGHAKGHSSHGQEAPAPSTNARAERPASKSQPSRAYVFAQLAREVEQITEHAAVDLGRRFSEPAAEPATPVTSEVPLTDAPAEEPVLAEPVLAMAPAALEVAEAESVVEPEPVVEPEEPIAIPVAPVVPPAAVPVRPAPVTAVAAEEKRPVNHPALESLRFPKSGVSRQWQEFLDQLAAQQ